MDVILCYVALCKAGIIILALGVGCRNFVV